MHIRANVAEYIHPIDKLDNIFNRFRKVVRILCVLRVYPTDCADTSTECGIGYTEHARIRAQGWFVHWMMT
jgi:hypothetical protein